MAKESPKAKKRLEADAIPPPPTLGEIRKARKAQLVEWCETFGLDAEGKVDDLRNRLREYVRGQEAAAEEAEAPEEEVEIVEEPEEKVHAAKAKPELDPATKALLSLRNRMNAKRPAFRRQEWFRYKRLGQVWRKPRGRHSKLRKHLRYRGNVPSIGFRGPRAVRGLHPSGFEEVLVHTVRDLEPVDPARQAVRIAHGVGTRKRIAIEEAAEERGVRVLNPMEVVE
jgi:large subunit ribosomal protein L32e